MNNRLTGLFVIQALFLVESLIFVPSLFSVHQGEEGYGFFILGPLLVIPAIFLAILTIWGLIESINQFYKRNHKAIVVLVFLFSLLSGVSSYLHFSGLVKQGLTFKDVQAFLR